MPKPQDTNAALSAVQEMEQLSLKLGHVRVTLLSHVLRLRILVTAGMWQQVADTIPKVEMVLGLSYDPSTTPKPNQPGVQQPDASITPKEEATFIYYDDPFEAAMALHTLMIIVVYFTHVGSAADAAPRLSHLHALLDSGALEKFPNGTVYVSESYSCK